MGLAGYQMSIDDPRELDEAGIAAYVDFVNDMTAEAWPDERPMSVALMRSQLTALPDRVSIRIAAARTVAGEVVGAAQSFLDPDHNENPDVFMANPKVRSPHRRRGIGTALLAEVIAEAERRGCSRLLGWTESAVPAGEAFASAVGADRKAFSHFNGLRLADVNVPMLEDWVAQGPRRAPGYELLAWDGAVPDAFIDRWVDVLGVMNDAPRDDLQLNDVTVTAAQWREAEDRMRATGIEPWFLAARHGDELVGLHMVVWSEHDPGFVDINDTGVRPAHRGHALGKWMKAAMTLRIMRERPGVTEIRTGNADSNDAMLGINRAMGYRPLMAGTTWEVSVPTAKAWLAQRGA